MKRLFFIILSLLLPLMSFSQIKDAGYYAKLRKAAELCINSRAFSLEEANNIVGEAIDAYGNLLETLPKNNRAEIEKTVIAMNNVAAGYYVNYLNESQAALDLCAETAEILERYPEESYEKYVMLACMAAAYMLDYKFDKAKECYEKCPETINDELLSAPIFTNLGIMFSRLGNDRNAMKMFQKAETIYKKNGCLNHYGYATLLAERGIMLSRTTEIQEGIADLRKAINIYEASYEKANPLTVSCMIDYAEANLKCGDSDEYQRIAEEIDNIIDSDFARKNINLWFKWVKLLTKEGIELNMYDELSEILEMGDELVEDNSSGERDYRNLLGIVNLGKGDYDKAVKEFSRMLTVEKKYVNNVFLYLPELQRAEYWEDCEERMNGLFSLCQGGKTVSSANNAGQLLYNAALFHKGLLLETSVGLSRIVEESGDAGLKADFLRLQGLRQRQLRESSIDESLLKESEDMERYLMTRALEYGNFTSFTSMAWQDIHKMLDNNEVAIEFVSYRKNNDTYYSAEVLRKDFDAPRHVFLFALTDEEQKQWSSSLSCDNRALGTAIWGKLLPLLKDGENIYFSASGILHSCPIEYFTISDGVRMNDKYSMRRLSSTRFISNKTAGNTEKTAVLYGGLNYNAGVEEITMSSAAIDVMRGNDTRLWKYLGGTKREVDIVGTILTEDGYIVHKFMGEAGTEDSFKALSGKSPGIIHLATHGFVMSSENLPLASAEDTGLLNAGIVFAGANNPPGSLEEAGMDDGVLNAKEISLLDLKNTELVVLSACETGLGHITGEGVFGLQRGFKKAGAKSLLMSLWPVNDQATELMMADFYCNLAAGMNNSEALQTARRAVWNQTFKINGEEIPGSNPMFWAGFVLLD